MRELAGLLALDGLLLAVGLSLVALLGLRLPGVPGFGLALATGWAAVALALGALLVVGVAPTVATVVVVAAAMTAGALVGKRRLRLAPPPVSAVLGGTAARVASVAGGGALAVALVSWLVGAARGAADTEWDGWAFWVPKALSVYYTGAPDGMLALPNPSYPPLLTAIDAAAFSFAGAPDPSLLVLQHAIVLSAGLLGVGALLRRVVPGALVWPALAVMAVAPVPHRYLDSVLADPPLALALALAAVAGTLWLLERETRDAVLAALFLGAAAAMKNEGLLLAYLLVVALAAGGGYRRPKALAVLGVAPLAAVLPWKLWYGAQDTTGTAAENYDFGRLVDVGLLADRIDRLGYAIDHMAAIAFGTGWLLALPVALTAAVVAAPRRPSVAIVALAWPAMAFLGLATTYWISDAPVEWYVSTSAERVLLSVLVVSVSMLPLSLAVVAGVDSDRAGADRGAPG